MSWPTATRRNHPVTSEIAEREHTRSGKRTTNAEKVLIVLENAGRYLTAGEVGEATGLGRYEAARRLNDLRQMERVIQCPKDVCTVQGTLQMTWRVAPGKGHEQGRLV